MQGFAHFRGVDDMERLAAWAKALGVPMAVLAVGVAWGTLRSDVRNVEQAMSHHATRSEMELQQAEILRRLDRIERKLDAEAAR